MSQETFYQPFHQDEILRFLNPLPLTQLTYSHLNQEMLCLNQRQHP